MRINELHDTRLPIDDDFHEVMKHETTPKKAEQIRKMGFKFEPTGIFFNREGANYSGGGYGGTMVTAVVEGPMRGLLDLSEEMPDDLGEFAEAEEIASHCRRKRKWAWFDELQFVVLDPKHITSID